MKFSILFSFLTVGAVLIASAFEFHLNFVRRQITIIFSLGIISRCLAELFALLALACMILERWFF